MSLVRSNAFSGNLCSSETKSSMETCLGITWVAINHLAVLRLRHRATGNPKFAADFADQRGQNQEKEIRENQRNPRRFWVALLCIPALAGDSRSTAQYKPWWLTPRACNPRRNRTCTAAQLHAGRRRAHFPSLQTRRPASATWIAADENS